jgi:hypothetical protein
LSTVGFGAFKGRRRITTSPSAGVEIVCMIKWQLKSRKTSKIEWKTPFAKDYKMSRTAASMDLNFT